VRRRTGRPSAWRGSPPPFGASGGPLDHGGATVVNGIVYINSGNALLAFSVDAK
jgi:hypothetical protein